MTVIESTNDKFNEVKLKEAIDILIECEKKENELMLEFIRSIRGALNSYIEVGIENEKI
jgi:hypothetical protein